MNPISPFSKRCVPAAGLDRGHERQHACHSALLGRHAHREAFEPPPGDRLSHPAPYQDLPRHQAGGGEDHAHRRCPAPTTSCSTRGPRLGGSALSIATTSTSKDTATR